MVTESTLVASSSSSNRSGGSWGWNPGGYGRRGPWWLYISTERPASIEEIEDFSERFCLHAVNAEWLRLVDRQFARLVVTDFRPPDNLDPARWRRDRIAPPRKDVDAVNGIFEKFVHNALNALKFSVPHEAHRANASLQAQEAARSAVARAHLRPVAKQQPLLRRERSAEEGLTDGRDVRRVAALSDGLLASSKTSSQGQERSGITSSGRLVGSVPTRFSCAKERAPLPPEPVAGKSTQDEEEDGAETASQQMMQEEESEETWTGTDEEERLDEEPQTKATEQPWHQAEALLRPPPPGGEPRPPADEEPAESDDGAPARAETLWIGLPCLGWWYTEWLPATVWSLEPNEEGDVQVLWKSEYSISTLPRSYIARPLLQ
eukprot:TRINITY_DN103769_c0_g1_i1.p1 TRINITY_DN103769_c0_g1~~TRINITY_DN103769_c0_g1_i1.p1  ORF type:complete len:377 (-),score=67.96 TRINITY_DN103769_c0_g1_i1:113-1243(-)